MKNKKGIALSNVLSIVLAIAGILLIFYASFQLYNFFGSEEDVNAQEFLNGLIGKMDNLEDGETGTFAMRWVEGYRILGYDKSLPREDVPEKCFFDSCVCICKAKGYIFETKKENWWEEQKNECQNSGICRDLEGKEVKILMKHRWTYAGVLCKWKDSEELAISFGKEEGLHHEGIIPEGELANLEIIKNGDSITFLKVIDKEVEEHTGIDSAGFRVKMLSELKAKNVEINEETKECYFVRN